MTQDEILDRLQPIFRDVLDDDEIVVAPELTAQDVDNWDSLNHVRLMLTIADEFHVTLSAGEISKLKNVADLVALLSSKAK